VTNSFADSGWRRELPTAYRPQRCLDLLNSGVTEGGLRGPRWRRVVRGYRTPATGVAVGTTQRILDVVPSLVDGAAIGGWAAAYVLGVDWLDGIDPHTGKQLPVDIVAPTLKRRSTAAVRFRASALPESDVVVRDDVAITAPSRTAFDGARWAADLAEAVAFLDAMLAFPQAVAGLLQRDFLEYVSGHRGWTGARRVQRAAELARPGVRSPWESRLRLIWQVGAGLPTPLINVPILDSDRVLLGIADLFDPEAGFVGEYDGEGHRDEDQHHRDNIREERFEAANLTVARADKTDVRSERDRLVRRLRDGYRRGLARDRSRDRWTLAPGWAAPCTDPEPTAFDHHDQRQLARETRGGG
jgi:hypothetical protein